MKSSAPFPGVMALGYTDDYLKLLDKLFDADYVGADMLLPLINYTTSIFQSEMEDQQSRPMLWIGMYIAFASLVCILAMVADLIYGFRSRKLWFPCKYFRINAAFLTVIAVAMKLPVDLTGSMLGKVDHTAKLGSMAFMCTMMANLLPCLATMDNNELLSNITALSLLVITLVVNVCIRMQTGGIYKFNNYNNPTVRDYFYSMLVPKFFAKSRQNAILPYIYVVFLVVLLLVHVCSSLAIIKSKNIIESKYQQGHRRASEDIRPSPGELSTVEKLQKHVSNHWIMAGSGSPQFITACFHTTSASGVICLTVTILHTYTMYSRTKSLLAVDYDSDYNWSTMVIAVVQFIGVMVGSIAPLARCFATLSFKVSSKIILYHFKFFKVETYWTQKLYDWKHTSIRLPFRSRHLEVVIETLKRLIVNICIGLQSGVVVVCKVIALIPFLFMICFFHCFRCIKLLLKALFSSLREKFEKLEGNNENFEKLEGSNDLRLYVLQLEDEIELGDRTLKGLSKSVSRLIQKAAKSQPSNLMKLILRKSTSGFEGVKKFDQVEDDVPSEDCWRLPVVTLTTIAISLPNIGQEEVDTLLESVREGLEYVTVVEESLNAKKDHASFQKAAATLWQEIRFDKKWLGNQLQNQAFQENTAGPIIEHFRDKAKNIVCLEDKSKDTTGGENGDSIHKSICANSMYRITKKILLTHTNKDATLSPTELFDNLSSTIADIISACLTNLPQAITMKCHTSVIEEREASVYEAAQLLGETTQIIETLRGRDIPNMDPSDLPFIEKWRAYLGNP